VSGDIFKVHALNHPAVQVFTDEWSRCVDVQLRGASDVSLYPFEARELAACLVEAADRMDKLPARQEKVYAGASSLSFEEAA
jgi:hypothetical protein